ncbi:MAG: DUF2309 domain-containing protein [Acidimicrobiia bacterium]|nr:DUF2309 domain-containing protein [Acidimicrobiia bacterium]
MTPPDVRRQELCAAVDEASRLVAPVWPIERFIAVNPLFDLRTDGFEHAAAAARRWLDAQGYPAASYLRGHLERGVIDPDDLRRVAAEQFEELSDVEVDALVEDIVGGVEHPSEPTGRTVLERAEGGAGGPLATAVDEEVARWCALLCDPAQSRLRDPAGAYATWRRLAIDDWRLRRLVGRDAQRELRGVPERPEDAIEQALARLGVDDDHRVDELRGQLCRLSGWAGWARWCDEWAVPDDPFVRLSRLDLLAIRLTVDALVLDRLGGHHGDEFGDHHDAASHPAVEVDRGVRTAGQGALAGQVVLEVLERTVRDDLLSRIDQGLQQSPLPTAPVAAPAPAPSAQVVCCIDVREEPFRRHLEAVGDYRTFGFAGFFAVPMRFRPLGAVETLPAAPALLQPTAEVCEVAAPDRLRQVARLERRRRGSVAAGELVDDLAHSPVAMYALAEGAGWVLGPVAAARTLRPRSARRTAAPTTVVTNGVGGFTLDERAAMIEGALRSMGLTDGFAPLVVLCGHGSTTAANPHGASLECGACGAHSGGANARAAAAVANDPEVRALLAERGIVVPDDTWFVAAEHDTTTDEVRLLDTDAVPTHLRARVAALTADLAIAGERLAAERLAQLPGHRPGRSALRQARARAGDWAQPWPEWGLAGNAAFVVADRALTEGADLGGRAFLHSYDAAADVNGSVLAGIFAAPLVVAHWINAQYYFSTVDPDVFGAGDKFLLNPIAGVGVVSGTGGDLRVGLPRQSVFGAEGPRHEPVRLTAVVDAPTDRIDAAVASVGVVAELLEGGWIRMVARRGPQHWMERQRNGDWRRIDAPALVGAGCSDSSPMEVEVP